jgi:hypothetical protein
LDQDETDGWTGFEFVRDLGCFRMDFDPIVPRFSSGDLDGNFPNIVGGKPLGMLIIVFDPNSEEGMPLLGLCDRVLQHVFGNMPPDSGYHGYDRKGGTREKSLY